MEKSILNEFVKYFSLNILETISLSYYFLVDKFFVPKTLGATDIASLNFSISVCSIIHSTRLMIGIVGTSRYSILKSKNEDRIVNKIFTTCIKLGALICSIYAIIVIFGSEYLALILGTGIYTLVITKTYLMTILCFAQFFILNNTMLTFVRNDNNPIFYVYSFSFNI